MARLESEELFDQQLMCSALKLDYDFSTRTGRLVVGSGECTDMTGCVNRFKAIDSKVETILTFADETPDTAYVKTPSGHWEARPAR